MFDPGGPEVEKRGPRLLPALLAQTAPALGQSQVVGLRLLGLVDFGKPKRACRRSRNRHRLLNGSRPPQASVGGSPTLGRWRRLQAQPTSTGLPPRHGLPPTPPASRQARSMARQPTHRRRQRRPTRGRFETSHPMYGAERRSGWSPIPFLASPAGYARLVTPKTRFQRRRARAIEPATPTAATAINRPSQRRKGTGSTAIAGGYSRW